MCFVPETLPRVVIGNAVKRHMSVDQDEMAIAEQKVSVLREMRFVTTMALQIMVTEPIVTFLAVYNGWAYGLLFLYLDGVFDVFVLNNGLSYVPYFHIRRPTAYLTATSAPISHTSTSLSVSSSCSASFPSKPTSTNATEKGEAKIAPKQDF